MGLLGWFSGNGDGEDRRLRDWKKRWEAAAAAADTGQAGPLRADLDAMALAEEAIEIEREMLDALDDLAALTSAVHDSGLPAIDTGHRVVGAERCHFTAPASMPDVLSQPSGRLLLTSGRAIFVGGGSGASVAWHAVSEARQVGRDVVLIRRDRETLYRFRCNTFSDALRAAFLAGALSRK